MQKIAKFIYFKVLGWSIDGVFPGHVKKFVIIAAPHTSWIDFPVGILVRKVWNEEINYVAKKELFKPLIGWFFRWTGGAPVDRRKNNDAVTAAAKIFEERDAFRLTLAPEGTRKKVTAWRSGFYYIAKAAKVPIVMVAFDYAKKCIKVSEPQFPTENQEEDFKTYRAFYKGVVGKVAKYS